MTSRWVSSPARLPELWSGVFSGCSLIYWLKQVIDRSFGFDTAVEEAQRAINAAHVEAESGENGIGVVKVMGRYSGMYMLPIPAIQIPDRKGAGSHLPLIFPVLLVSMMQSSTPLMEFSLKYMNMVLDKCMQDSLQCMPPLQAGTWTAA